MKHYLSLIIFFSSFIFADDTPISHGPIGVMGDHTHQKDEIMVSLRFSTMKMRGNLLGGNTINDNQIIEIPNPNAGMPNAPSNLSIVPKEMDMKMFMLGGMLAVTDKVTLMGMMMFQDLSMSSNTFQGMMNRNLLGSFNLSSEALSNISFYGLVDIFDYDLEKSIISIGITKSIGNNNKTGNILTPMNTRIDMIMPYGMQGSDKSTKLNLAYNHKIFYDSNSIGVQVKTDLNIDEKNWAFGNKYETSIWYQELVNDNLAWSIRYKIAKEESIEGTDSRIIGPVQTANPFNYGGINSYLGVGLNTTFRLFQSDHSDRLALELLMPINQNKNNLQMEDKNKIIIGYQKAF